MKNKLTPKIIKKAIKVLRKYKVPKPYYYKVKVENPRESGDLLDGWKPVEEIIYKSDIRNI